MSEEVIHMLIKNIQRATKDNTNFRQVLFTGSQCQVVLMSIAVGDEIGLEVHPHTDQIIFIAEGVGEAIVGHELHEIYDGDMVFVPANTQHNIINKGDSPLQLFTTYAPPEHPDGLIEQTKRKTE